MKAYAIMGLLIMLTVTGCATDILKTPKYTSDYAIIDTLKRENLSKVDIGPGNLLSRLKNAGYGNYNLYQTLLQMQADASPSVAGIITPAFLNTLANCPTGSQIFTTMLNDFHSDSSLAISTDGTVQTVKVYAKDYFNKTGASTLLTSLSGAAAEDTNFVHSGFQPSIAEFNAPLMSWTVGNTKYNVFAITSGFVPAQTVTPTPTKIPFMDQRRKKNG